MTRFFKLREDTLEPPSVKKEFVAAHGKKGMTDFIMNIVNEKILKEKKYNRLASPLALSFAMAAMLKKPEHELNLILKAFHKTAQKPEGGNDGTYSKETLDAMVEEIEIAIDEFNELHGNTPSELSPNNDDKSPAPLAA